MMEEKQIVRYRGRWWVLEKIEKEMAILWSNGQPALARIEEIEYLKDKP